MQVPEPTICSWTGGSEGMRFGSLLVSFQRYARPFRDIIATVPSSLGALPVARDNSDFLLPLAFDEAFWIGVVPVVTSACDNTILRAHRIGRDVMLLPILPMYPGAQVGVVPGFARGDELYDTFCRDTVGEIFMAVGTSTARLLPIDPESYAVPRRAHADVADLHARQQAGELRSLDRRADRIGQLPTRTTRYGFGETRVAALATLTLTVLWGSLPSGVITARFVGRTLALYRIGLGAP